MVLARTPALGAGLRQRKREGSFRSGRAPHGAVQSALTLGQAVPARSRAADANAGAISDRALLIAGLKRRASLFGSFLRVSRVAL